MYKPVQEEQQIYVWEPLRSDRTVRQRGRAVAWPKLRVNLDIARVNASEGTADTVL